MTKGHFGPTSICWVIPVFPVPGLVLEHRDKEEMVLTPPVNKLPLADALQMVLLFLRTT